MRFSKEASEKRPRFAYLPFGGGPRVCIGATLAVTEATVILAVLAQKFRLRLKEPQEVKLQTRITLRPKDRLLAILERRQGDGYPLARPFPAAEQLRRYSLILRRYWL